MKNKDHLTDELNEQAPLLGSLKEKVSGGLQVPATYFSELETEVFKQLEAIGAQRQPVAKPPKPSLWQIFQGLWQPRLALAFAGVLTLGLAAWWYFQPAASTNPALAAVTAEDAESYLMNHLMEFEPEQIAQALPAESLPSIDIEDPNAANDQPAAKQEFKLRQQDIDDLLRDMTDEELRDLLL